MRTVPVKMVSLIVSFRFVPFVRLFVLVQRTQARGEYRTRPPLRWGKPPRPQWRQDLSRTPIATCAPFQSNVRSFRFVSFFPFVSFFRFAYLFAYLFVLFFFCLPYMILGWFAYLVALLTLPSSFPFVLCGTAYTRQEGSIGRGHLSGEENPPGRNDGKICPVPPLPRARHSSQTFSRSISSVSFRCLRCRRRGGVWSPHVVVRRKETKRSRKNSGNEISTKITWCYRTSGSSRNKKQTHTNSNPEPDHHRLSGYYSR